MKLRRNVGTSVRALFTHRLRTTLAVLSVSIGTAAVLVTNAIGTGADRNIQRGIESLGVNLVVVRPAQVRRTAARRELNGTVKTLTLADYEAIAELPGVARIAPGIDGAVRVKAGTRTVPTQLLGTTPEFFDVRRFRLARGRIFDEDDDRAARRVVVLCARVADQLADPDIVGKQVRIRGIPFDVIGVLAPKGVLADGDEDDQVIVPTRTALRRLLNVTWLSAVYVSTSDPGAVDATETAIGGLLARRHPLRQTLQAAFEIQDASRFFTLQQRTTAALASLTTVLAGVALGVGGTGIMALMLLSVRERTSEIGIRLAVGASPRDIVVQFLLESLILALSGWTVGAALGGAGALAIKLGMGWPVAVPISALLSSFGVGLVIGLGFGAVPARRASLVQPARALVAA
ncbi:MAG TPA: ABC transporter permease [Gemmatimonadaceae bacterium]